MYEHEPSDDGKVFDSPIADAPNLYGTHHIGAPTEQAQLAVAEETVRIVTERVGRAPPDIHPSAGQYRNVKHAIAAAL